MIVLPDVNVLVYAFREGAQRHAIYRDWLVELLDGPDEILLVDSVLVSCVRIVTHPGIVDPPAPTAAALGFVAAVQQAPRSRAAAPSPAVWDALRRYVAGDRMIRGNLVPDAYLAAVAIAHRASRNRRHGRSWLRPLPGAAVVGPGRRLIGPFGNNWGTSRFAPQASGKRQDR